MSTINPTPQNVTDPSVGAPARFPACIREQLDAGAIIATIVLLVDGLGLLLLGDGSIIPLPGLLRTLGGLCGLFYLMFGWVRYLAGLGGSLCAGLGLVVAWRMDPRRTRILRVVQLGSILVLSALLIPGHQVLDFALSHRVERTGGRPQLQAWAVETLQRRREHPQATDYIRREDTPPEIQALGAYSITVWDRRPGPAYLELRVGGGGFIETTRGYLVGPPDMTPPTHPRRWADGLYTYGLP